MTLCVSNFWHPRGWGDQWKGSDQRGQMARPPLTILYGYFHCADFC